MTTPATLLEITSLLGGTTGMTMALGFLVVVSVVAVIVLKILAKTVKAAVRMFVFFLILAIAVVGAGVLLMKHSAPGESPTKKPTSKQKRR
jgi:chromate transport protein ChrA